jgi:hypothetical protein
MSYQTFDPSGGKSEESKVNWSHVRSRVAVSKKERKPGLRIFPFGFQRTGPSSVRRKLAASLVLECSRHELDRGNRKGVAIAVVRGWPDSAAGCNQRSKMGQIESSTAPKLYFASARSLFSCYPSPPFPDSRMRSESDSTSPSLPTSSIPNRPTIIGYRIPASPPLETGHPSSPAPVPSAGVASATSTTAWWQWPRRNRRPSAPRHWLPPD